MHAHGIDNNYCVLERNVADDSSLGYIFSLLFVCALKVCGNFRAS